MKRRVPGSIVLLVALAATVAFVPSAGAGDLEDPSVVTVTKVVEGEVPDGTEFVVEVDCGDEGGPVELTFGAAGGTEEVFVDFGGCTVTETDDGGAASVTYVCQIDDPGDQGEPSTCQGDQTVQVDAPGTLATVTVTNTFPTTEVEPDEAPAEIADVVAARPSFTG